MKLPPLFALLAAAGYSAVPGKPEPPKNMMAAIPLHFEPNVGQTDPRVSFTARGGGMSIFVTPDETVLARRGAAPVRMKLRGGKRAKFEPVDKLPGVSNYYRGNDPRKWREGVPHYARVRARSVYEGIDVVYYGNGRRLEYDFVVSPGADASKIELAYEGAESMRIDKGGDLVLVTKAGELRQRKPVVYQEVAGRRIEVAAEYSIRGGSVRFELARYDESRPVVIDPILEYGTFLGGSSTDSATAVAADNTGVWVGGITASSDFPLANPADLTWVNAEGFVTKINGAGTALIFSTFLGGAAPDGVSDLSTDPTGNAFVTGYTESADFPVVRPIQSSYGSGTDAFAAKISPSGSLVAATFLGGSSFDQCGRLVWSVSGITLACATQSVTFLGVPSSNGPILVRLSLDAASVIFIRSLEGAYSFGGLAAAPDGALYVTGTTRAGASISATQGAFQPASGGGSDAFVAKLNAAGDQWIYVTYLGGASADEGNAITVDSSGLAYVAGTTRSPDFPLKAARDSVLGNGTQPDIDAFLAVFNPTGSALVFSTYFGWSGTDDAAEIALMPDGSAVIGGLTTSTDFPIVAGWRSEMGEAAIEHYFAKFDATGVLKYSSFFGGFSASGLWRMAAAPGGAVVVVGDLAHTGRSTPLEQVVSTGAYDTSAGGTYDGYVARFVDGPAPVPVTIASSPLGRRLIVDGRPAVTPAVFSWQPGTFHSLDASAPQLEGQTYYAFSSWSQGGGGVQRITAPAVTAIYTATYSATPCIYSFEPAVVRSRFEGRLESSTLTTQSLCPWTPQFSAPWLILSGHDGPAGPGRVTFFTALNLGAPRSATVTAGSATITVTQAGSQGNLPSPAITSPTSGQVIRRLGVSLSWAPVPGASGYEINVLQSSPCCSPTGGSLVYFGQHAGATLAGANVDLPDGEYVAYVRACANGKFDDLACGRYGTVPFSVDLLAPAEAPVILTPLGNQTLGTSTNVISWRAVQNATSYEVTLRELISGRTDLQINTATLSTVFTMRSPADYELTVRACQFKCSQAKSAVRFSVLLQPVSQTRPTGLAAQITNANTLNLSWNPVTNADLYRVQVVQPNAGPGGGALTVAARQVSTTNASLQVPAGAATVVLNACNGDGCGPPSTIAVNPTGPNPSVPIVATPMPVVVADGPNITISWSRIPGDNGSNTDYRLYVGDLSRDGPALDVITKNNFYGAFLRAEGRRYDALVFATQNGVTVTGPASGFMVAGSSATAPLITSPTHDSTFKQGPFRLAWSPIPDAVRYQYYVGRPGQSGPVLTGVTPGIFVDTTLSVTAPALHQAIVRACPSANTSQCSPDSDAGWGPWSNAVTGTTSFTITP